MIMGTGEERSPAGTLVGSRVEWLDDRTGKPLNQHGRAAAFVRDYYARERSWPRLKWIVEFAGVGTGTAWRALSKVKNEEFTVICE